MFDYYRWDEKEIENLISLTSINGKQQQIRKLRGVLVMVLLDFIIISIILLQDLVNTIHLEAIKLGKECWIGKRHYN